MKSIQYLLNVLHSVDWIGRDWRNVGMMVNIVWYKLEQRAKKSTKLGYIELKHGKSLV